MQPWTKTVHVNLVIPNHLNLNAEPTNAYRNEESKNTREITLSNPKSQWCAQGARAAAPKGVGVPAPGAVLDPIYLVTLSLVILLLLDCSQNECLRLAMIPDHHIRYLQHCHLHHHHQQQRNLGVDFIEGRPSARNLRSSEAQASLIPKQSLWVWALQAILRRSTLFE